MKRLRIFSKVFGICMVIFLSVPLLGQETTGGLQGTVKDPTDALIPGATVEVSSPALIGRKSSVSNSGGFFRIDQLPTGVYAVTVTAPGFAPQTFSNVDIKTGELPKINVVLSVGAVQQTIDVATTAEVLDVTLSKVQTIISEEVLNALPKSRSFQSLITMAPGARQEPLSSARENRSNGFQIDGATDSENVYLIDGVNTTNLLGGGVGKDFQSDFIQEVQVKSSGFEAEFGGALGGVINAVAKRGSNTWHGEVKGYFQSAALGATDACAAGFTASHSPAYWTFLNNNVPSGYTGLECGLRLNPATALNTTARLDGTPEFYVPKKDSRHIIEPGYEIGGPVFTDRLWLFSSYIPSLDSIARTVNFRCPTSNASCTFAGPRRFTQNFTQHNAFNRLDYRATNSLRLFGSWNYAYARLTGSLPSPDSARGQVNSGATIDPTTLRPDAGAVNPYSLYSFSGDWTPLPKFLINARYGYFFTNFSSRGTPTGVRYEYRTALNTANRDVDNNPFPASAPFNSSGFSNMPSNFATIHDAFKRKSINTDLSYFVGNVSGVHSLKLGYMWQKQENDVLVSANTAVVDLFWGIRYTPATSATACATVQASNAAGVCQGQYGYFDVGSQTTSTSGATKATERAFYIQDSWIVRNTGLTLNLGVRFDRETNPPYNPNTFPPIEFGWGEKIAPRLGGAYDVLHNGKVKLYASYGKFFDIMKLNLTRSKSGAYWHTCVYALDTLDLSTITPTLATGAGCPQSGPAPGVNARFIENVNLRALNNDERDPAFQSGMKPISSHEFTTGVDWTVSPRLLVETRYTRKRLDNTIEDMAITDNLGFYNGNPGSAYGDVLHRPTLIPDANGVLYLNTVPFCDECPHMPKAERRYDALEVRATRRGGSRWFGTVSYTYSKLRGNYSGLVDTDPTDANGGRHSPSTARAFDLPTMTYTPSGEPDFGPLSTDRPHTVKVFGFYKLPWLGQETSFGISQAIYQGTPISTCIGTISGTNPASSCQIAEGRGNFVLAHREANGTMVKDGVIEDYRTPAYWQTDLNVKHEIKLRSDETRRIVIEANAYNVLNQHSATSYYQFLAAAGSVAPSRASRFSGDPRFDWGKVMNGYDYVDAFNATGAFAGVQAPLTLSNRYGQPRTFQLARQFRLAVRYVF